MSAQRAGNVQLMKASLVAVSLVVVTSCGTQTDAVKEQAAGEQKVVLSSEAQAIRDEVDRFYDSWAGGNDGQQAAEVLSSFGVNGEYSACMAERGYDVPWQRTITGVSNLDALNATRWLREPMRPRFSLIALKNAQDARMNALHGESITDVENLVGLECIKQSSGTSDRDAASLADPPGYVKLIEAWDRRIVAATTPVTGSPADNDECVAKGDLPGKPEGSTNADEILDAMTWAMLDLAPSAGSVPLGSDAPTEAWTDYLAVEDRLLTIEWECAAPVYEAGMRALPDVIEQFQQDYAPEIAQLTRHWDAVKADARKLGWSEATPFASMTPK